MLNKQKIIHEYLIEKKSIYEIAENHGTYAQKIRRLLIKCEVPLRSKGEAQSIALSSGRMTHPTKDKGHSQAAKEKISESAHNTWEKMSDEKYDARVSKMKENWESIPKAVRDEMQQKAAEAVRKAAKEGSKMEKFLDVYLKEQGFVVYYHKKFEIPGHVLEVDIYLPAENIAIEIDGPSHFLPIWGEERLQKHIEADELKNGMLLKSGVKILRIKNLNKAFTSKAQRDTAKGVLDGISRLKNGENFIELEIN